jgi:hypothetical protein
LVLSRSLQQRVDRKFLLSERRLPSLLSRLQPSFSVLTAGNAFWARYDSIYFDTKERLLYHAHRCDRLPRFKVRIRRHVDRQLAFLEIKRKGANRRTTKYRLPMPMTQAVLCERESAFLAESVPAIAGCDLAAVISVSFQRLTLVANEAMERLTLDRGLVFASAGQRTEMPLLIVGEAKQGQIMNRSGSVGAFRAIRAREQSFSKYCIGTALLSDAPAHVFKPSLRAAARQLA